ncbi:hypothetical protein XELAEV_18011746mg [Xenopus laevis]|uniref:60S ribosomal protein L31 n=1 Tax=Xenopus laevis TaxID=8355 RepID=A0A974HXI7_XENLA|nr:hypothetical protein XELAEV_18011746mg [Xenopus laevis]
MAPAKKGCEKKKGRSAINDVVTKDYTINIHKMIHGIGFKKRAPRAPREIRKFTVKEMCTPDVRIETEQSRNAMKMKTFLTNFTHWSPVPVTNYKGLQTVNVD